MRTNSSLSFHPTQQDSLGLLRTSWPNSSSIKEVEKGQTPSHRDAGPAGAAGTGGWSHPRELLARRINDRLWPTVPLTTVLQMPQKLLLLGQQGRNVLKQKRLLMLVPRVDRPLLAVFGTQLAEGKWRKEKAETAAAFTAGAQSCCK